MYTFPFYTDNAEKLEWDAITEFYPWVKDMIHVPQDPIWHAEGNVNIHTMMVTKELLKLEEFHQESEQAKNILFQGALMHDIEKRSTTITDDYSEEEQRICISAPRHAKKGEYTSREILYQENVPFSIREQVCKIVRWHGVPLWTIDKGDPKKTILKSSLHIPNKWLAMFAKADALGRICKDKDDLLTRILLFEELCKENNAWEQPYQFPNNLAKWVYFSDENKTYPNYLPFDDYVGEMIIMCGLPGAGKSTLIQQRFKGLPVISMDEMRRKLQVKHNDKKAQGQIIQQTKESVKQHLRQSLKFVVDATNITELDRSKLIELAKTYKSKTRIIYVEPPYKTLISQNKNRIHTVPEKAVLKYLRNLEVPCPSEAVEVEFITS